MSSYEGRAAMRVGATEGRFLLPQCDANRESILFSYDTSQEATSFLCYATDCKHKAIKCDDDGPFFLIILYSRNFLKILCLRS